MSDADNKAVSTVTVARQPHSASMWTLNKDTGPDRLLIIITDKHTHACQEVIQGIKVTNGFKGVVWHLWKYALLLSTRIIFTSVS